MAPRSVCIVTQQYGSVFSGIGLHARNLLTGLLRDGHRVTLLTQVGQCGDVVAKGLEVLTVPAAYLQDSQARWISLAWHFARRLRQVNGAQRFDIVHFTDAREALFFAGSHPAVVGNTNDYYAAELRSGKYYRRHYADWWKRWPYYVLLHQCEKIGLRHLKALIANSDYTKEVIQQTYQLDHHRLFKCFKCIDLSLFDGVAQSYDRRDLILFVGGNMQRKGLQVLIRAAPLVLIERPNVEFYVVGQDSNLPRMRRLCHELGVDEHFVFTGWMSNQGLLQLYRQSAVFVMPSLMEAFGVVFLEAMASGTPVVGTKVGGVPELVEHGKNGLLVEPDVPEELAQALLAILRNPGLAAQLAENGWKTAQHFGVEQMLACTYGVYSQLLEEPF